MSEEGKKILDNLYDTIKSIPQNPITQLDETNTILHIFAVKEETDKTTDEKLNKDSVVVD